MDNTKATPAKVKGYFLSPTAKWALVIGSVLAIAWASYSIGSGRSVNHEALLEKIKPWLEAAYFLHGPILVLITLFGLQQLKLTRDEMKLTKEDMVIRNDRAAKEKALEYAAHYADTIIPLSGTAISLINEQNLTWKRDTVSDFTPGSVLPENLANVHVIHKNRETSQCIYSVLNELQALSAAFYTGVADEEVGFDIMGPAFCGNVSTYYPYICVHRAEKATPLWKFIVELDCIWRNRMKMMKLDLDEEDIRQQKTSVPVKQGNRIGQSNN